MEYLLDGLIFAGVTLITLSLCWMIVFIPDWWVKRKEDKNKTIWLDYLAILVGFFQCFVGGTILFWLHCKSVIGYGGKLEHLSRPLDLPWRIIVTGWVLCILLFLGANAAYLAKNREPY